MSERPGKRKRKTHFTVVPVTATMKKANEAAALREKTETPRNIQFEDASGKTDPYSFRPEAIKRHL